jgi:hypothetical protein
MGAELGLSLSRKTIDRVFENKVLRRMFVHSRAAVIILWRKLGDGESHNLHSSFNKKDLRKDYDADRTRRTSWRNQNG